jgi:peptidoglycan hydrolase-like protein with peptidoglycan-binding domain
MFTNTPGPANRKKTSGKVVAALVAAGVAVAGVATSITLALTRPEVAPAPVNDLPAASATPTPAAPSSSASTVGPVPHHSSVPAAPSASIRLLQQHLAQLNYYGGPITGYVNHDTTEAITYLQRDAGLPRTGRMNQRTEDALARMLADGNNQMGGGGTPTPAQPTSGSVKRLQQELAQLNYYMGPVNGQLNPATQQAITYLQRDAHLPQTGKMDQASRAALARMLARGNSQMDRAES